MVPYHLFIYFCEKWKGIPHLLSSDYETDVLDHNKYCLTFKGLYWTSFRVYVSVSVVYISKTSIQNFVYVVVQKPQFALCSQPPPKLLACVPNLETVPSAFPRSQRASCHWPARVINPVIVPFLTSQRGNLQNLWVFVNVHWKVESSKQVSVTFFCVGLLNREAKGCFS